MADSVLANGVAAPAGATPRSGLALYRRYRSATFAEVIGQEHVTEPLSTALRTGRINHAYLFSGPRGCGKTSSARIMARSLNCAQGPTPTPCGVCDSCRELAPNASGSIDVIEIDAASHNGVDDARELRERAYYAPVRDRYKVYIIDEAHMVTTHAFNALLKVVEEPPEHLVFIFATTEPDKVLQTIRSRTHHYPFRLVPPGVLRAHLERVCADEHVATEPAVFPLIVRASGGSVRDALSLLDQLMAGAGSDGVTYAAAVALLGVTDSALLDDMIDALAVGDASSVYGTIERVVDAGHEPRRFATDLLDRLRDLLILSSVPDAVDKGLLDVPGDALARMVDQAARIGTASAARYAEIVHTALTEMRGTTAARLLLELVCARMLLPDASTDAAALLQRIERLERVREITGAEDAPSGGPPVARKADVASPDEGAAAVPPPAQDVLASPPEPAGASSSDVDVTALRQIWPDVLDNVKQVSKTTRVMVDSAQVAAANGTHVRLVMDNAYLLRRLVEEPKHAAIVAAAIAQLLPGDWTIDVEQGAAPGELPLDSPTAAPPASAPAFTAPASSAPAALPSAASAPVAVIVGASETGSAAVSSSVDPSSVGPPRLDPAVLDRRAAATDPGPSAQWPTVVTAEATAEAVRAGQPPATEKPRRQRGTRAPRPDRGGDPGPSAADRTEAPDETEPPDDDEARSIRHDPEAEALSLLETGLGARRILD